MPFPPAPCNAIIYLEKEEALPPHPLSYQGYVHQNKVEIHFEGKLHSPMVTRTSTVRSGAGQDAECKIIRPSMVCKIIKAELSLCFQNLKDT